MKSPQEFFRQLEIEVRTFAEKLPIDTFLPSPETYPSDLSPSSLAAEAVQARELGGFDEEPSTYPRQRRHDTEKRTPQEDQDPPLSLQEEVQEFMSRNQPAHLDLEEDADLLRGYDPSLHPED